MNKFFKKLEFDQILNQLSAFATMVKTKEIITNLTPLNDLVKINQALDETDEALRIITRFDKAPMYLTNDLQPLFSFCEKGGVLNGSQIYEFVRLLQTVKTNLLHLQALEKEKMNVTYYKSYLEQTFYDEQMLKKLTKSVDETGYILDEASSNLMSIRRKIRAIDGKIKQHLQELVTKESNKLSQLSVSIRDDHFVLAVKAEYKNTIKGTVYDVSATSQTFFIEPLAVTQLNFEKRKLFEDEKSECQVILQQLSQQLMPNIALYRTTYLTLVHIDFIFSKALLAKKQNSCRPHVNNQHQMSLINARHPLLNVPKIIPNTVDFDQYLGIIITGPNTGGKTVLLKTVGLLSIMVKCGLLIPADAKSNMMIFDKICCDIGDDQSIVENLSTFSSHMQNIISIINMVTPHSLVLFDEIGGGTDPAEGCSLAIAILQYLIDNKISFITTTHYAQLKLFAYATPCVINASMQFNQETLTPTYQLVLGLPGSSNAFSIAEKLGMRKVIIEKAKATLLNDNQDMKKLIDNVESLMHEVKNKEQILDQQLKEIDGQRLVLEKQISTFNIEKKKVVEDIKKETQKEMDKRANKLLELLDEAKKLKDRNVKLHEINEIKRAFTNLDAANSEKAGDELENNVQNFSVGDDVFVVKYDQYASITKVLKNNNYEINVGNMRLKVKGSELKRHQNSRQTNNHSSTVRVISTTKISLSLDLRGMRFEEAKEKIEQYFDDLMLSNIKQVTIIHGYGTGTIRKLVHDYLKQNNSVLSYRFGGDGEGGMGSTVVTLK